MTVAGPAGDPGFPVVGCHAGQDVHEITLTSPSGMEARVLTWGAVIRDLRVPLADGRVLGVVLGLEDFADYPAHSPYFGALVGRYANRISGGRFHLDGQVYDLDRNEGGATTLHGGADGFASRVWTVLARTAESVTLGLASPDGDQGFPGRLDVRCRYALGPTGSLVVDLEASTDRPTPVSLAQHSYFNLDGTPDLAAHRLRVFAEAYTPVGADMIPTGEIATVAGTPFDFRAPQGLSGRGVGYDHNFVLAGPLVPGEGLRAAAELVSLRSGLRMEVRTTKPGLQVYDGRKIRVPAAGLDGRRYGSHAGLCLETQFFPDSPNRPEFPDSILRPGATYRHRTVFAFSAV